MDVHKYTAQTERLEVVETGRRRRWSDDEKLRIVLESLETPRAISLTARRHGISRSLLVSWRRVFRAEPMDLAYSRPASRGRWLLPGGGCSGMQRVDDRPHGEGSSHYCRCR